MNPRTHKSDDSRFVTLDQLAEKLNVGRTTARKIAVQAGALRKFGTATRADTEVVFEYVSKNCVAKE